MILKNVVLFKPWLVTAFSFFLFFFLHEGNAKNFYMINYILINRIGGQIREKIDFGLSELTSQARSNSENLSQFFPELTY